MFKLSFSHKLSTTYFVFFVVLILSSSTLFALPQDGSVRSGDVQLNQVNSKRLDVNQSSDKAIIDWRSFSIDQDEHTHFQMPSTDSINLSRVTGGQRSDIFGKLSSNGRLMLINPNGVVFGQNSRVDVHGLVATTNDIRNQDFLANRFHFNIPGNSSARIINRGTINIGNAGLLAFVAPGVENSGIINARLGRVGLASSNQFTLDLYGDNLITLGVEGKVLETVYGEDGRPISSLIDQSGTINADGGQVYLQTNAARDIVDHAINVSGIIEAKTAIKKRGNIILNGGKEGKVKVSGVLDASGLSSGQTGGTVHVLGDEVILEKARIFASGFNGGGTVLVGGDYQGRGSVLNARNNYFDIDSQIYADATNNGNGGKVILWADERTDAFGKIYARGGAFGGDGGFVETSGKQILAVTQAADVSAPFGKPGEWLLDPFDIEIVDSLSNAALTGGNKVDVAIINAALNNGTSVKIQSNNNGAGEGNILITSAISKTSGNDATLTLDAAGGITINNTITSTSGALTLAFLAATGVVVNNDLTLNGGTVTLNSNETFSRTNFENPGRQNIVQISHLSGASRPAEVHVSGTPSGLVHLSGNQNTTNTSASHGTSITLSGVAVSTSGGSATFEDAVDLSTGSSSVTTSDGDITFNGTLNGAQTLSLAASTGNISFNGIIGGATTLTDFTISSSSSTTFNSDSNFGGTLTTINALNGINILGDMTNSAATSCCVTTFFNADSDSNGTGTLSLSGGKTFTSLGSINFLGADFDIQGNITTPLGMQFRRVASGSMGIGDVAGNATISGDEISRITSKGLDFRMDASVFEFNIDNVQASQTENISGGIRIFGTQDNSESSINFINNSSSFMGTTLNIGPFGRIKTINFNTDVISDGGISVTGTTINVTGNSKVSTNNLGSSFTKGQFVVDADNLIMSSGSEFDAGSGIMSVSVTEGMTLGLLSSTSSSSSAISLTAGSAGIRDADTNGALDISAPNGGLVVSASGGFGTFENPIEYNTSSLDIPSSQDFSSPSVLANQAFTTTLGQSLETVTTTRTFRSSSDTFSLVSYSPVLNLGNSPTTSIGGFLPSLRSLVTNVFSQSFSLFETITTTTTSFTSTFLTSGSSNTQFGNLFAMDALNNSSFGTGIFSQVNNRDSGLQNVSNLGLRSLVQTSTVSRILQRTSFTRSSQFQSFGMGSTQFGGRIPIGTRSLGAVRTIGGGIATCLLSPSGSVRAVNVLADSNGRINNQNNFNNVGLNFTSPSSSFSGRASSSNLNGNSRTGNNTGRGSLSPRTATPPGSITDTRVSGDPAPTGNTANTRNNRAVGNSDLGVTSLSDSNVDARISGGSTPIANISGGTTSVGARISGSSTSTRTTTSAGNTSGVGTSGFGMTAPTDTNVDTRISGGSTPNVNANISGGTTSVGARISGGETSNINANISGGETSFGSRISGSVTTGITANISGTMTSSTNSNLGSRTNDRNLNNPDQFQGNANAEQRSLDARISGNETPGQARSNSNANSARTRFSEGVSQSNNANLSGSNSNDEVLGTTTPSINSNLGSRTNDRNLNNPDQFQGNANAEQRSLDARISDNEAPGQARSNSNGNSARTRFSEGVSQSNNANLSGSNSNYEVLGTTTSSTNSNLGSRTNDRNLNNPDQFQGNANAEQRSLDARISGNETPGQARNNSSTSDPNLDNRIREMRNRLVANTATERQNIPTNNTSEQTLQQRMSNLYSRFVGRNRGTSNSSDEEEGN